MIVRGIPAGRQRPVGSSMPLLLKASRTFCAAQGWYGAPSRPTGRSLDDGSAGAEGSRPLPPTPEPRFACSHDPRCVLPPCQTPVRSGFPSVARGTALLGVCAAAEIVHTAATIAVRTTRRIIAPPQRECFLRRLCRP